MTLGSRNHCDAQFQNPPFGAEVLGRVSLFLPARTVKMKCGDTRAQPTRVWATRALFSGEFTFMHKVPFCKTAGNDSTFKSHVLNELQALSVVTVIFFGVAFDSLLDFKPNHDFTAVKNCFDNTCPLKWLTNVGFDRENVLDIILDASMVIVATSVMFSGLSLVGFVVLQSIIMRLPDDAAMSAFLQNFGWFKNLPWIYWIVSIFLFASSIAMRYAIIYFRTWTGVLFATSVNICLGFGMIAVLMTGIKMSSMFGYQEATYLPLTLSAEEVCEDVELYMARTPEEEVSIHHCIKSLEAVTPNGAAVHLADVARARVVAEFEKQLLHVYATTIRTSLPTKGGTRSFQAMQLLGSLGIGSHALPPNLSNDSITHCFSGESSGIEEHATSKVLPRVPDATDVMEAWLRAKAAIDGLRLGTEVGRSTAFCATAGDGGFAVGALRQSQELPTRPRFQSGTEQSSAPQGGVGQQGRPNTGGTLKAGQKRSEEMNE